MKIPLLKSDMLSSLNEGAIAEYLLGCDFPSPSFWKSLAVSLVVGTLSALPIVVSSGRTPMYASIEVQVASQKARPTLEPLGLFMPYSRRLAKSNNIADQSAVSAVEYR